MELKNNPNLVIKESDKSGACVVMVQIFFYTKILEIVNDNTTYKELDTNIDSKIHKKITNLTEKYHEELTQKEINYLYLYGLPKVHKSDKIKREIENKPLEYIEVDQPEDLEMRPIVAGPIFVTSRLCDFLDILLKPYLKHVKTMSEKV